MIKDILENYYIYKDISDNIKNGFKWLKSQDLINIPDGKYTIDGNKIYANVQTYETKTTALFEAHRKYIDIQYVIKGIEAVGITNLSNCTTVEDYDPVNDIEFLNCNNNRSEEILNAGEFLILFPQDAHQPSLKYSNNETVKKVVLKILSD